MSRIFLHNWIEVYRETQNLEFMTSKIAVNWVLHDTIKRLDVSVLPHTTTRCDKIWSLIMTHIFISFELTDIKCNYHSSLMSHEPKLHELQLFTFYSITIEYSATNWNHCRFSLLKWLNQMMNSEKFEQIVQKDRCVFYYKGNLFIQTYNTC